MSLLAIISLCLYTCVAVWSGREWLSGEPQARQSALLNVLAWLAIVFHGIAVFQAIFTEGGMLLGFFPTANLIAWLIVFTAQLSSLKMPILRLLPPMYVLAALNLVVYLIVPEQGTLYPNFETGLSIHILSSILAYSIITLAAGQACALYLQDHALKARKVTGLIEWLPPLQTMEQLLFQMVGAGLLLLTLSIASGAFFLEDIFAQHLVHKTVFTLCAWLIFATLLWGRFQMGWRGNTAIRWTLTGFAALMLAYFGSKFVLELILGR